MKKQNLLITTLAAALAVSLALTAFFAIRCRELKRVRVIEDHPRTENGFRFSSAGVVVEGYDGVLSGELDIPYCLNDSRVIGISRWAFHSGMEQVTGIEIPDGVTFIGGYAFSGLDQCRRVRLPDSLTRIGECAFQLCKGLEYIVIPKGVAQIGARALGQCYGLRIVVFEGPPPSITPYEGDDDNPGESLCIYDEEIMSPTTLILPEHAKAWDAVVKDGPVSAGRATWQGYPIRVTGSKPR